MSAILSAISLFGLPLVKILSSLLMSLLTETFIKKALVHSMEFLAKKTENELDDKIAKDLKEAWNIQE